MRERDTGQVGLEGDRAHPDEQEGEGADELGRRAMSPLWAHGAER
jgi:hypothetical protein